MNALAAAAEWRLLGLLFERPRPGWHQEITALAAEIRDPELLEAAAASVSAHESEYLDVLGPGGSVSPREVAYRGREDPGAIVADVSAFYAAFAFHPRAEDPPDHVAVEAGFAGYLCLKEAYASARGNGEAANTAAAARARFTAEHLRFVAAPLGARIAGLSPVPHLLLAAAALVQRTGTVPAGTADTPADEELGDGLGCDGCAGPCA
jgi:hypothetical protein